MPSRTGLLLRSQRRSAAGDPFFGAIARLAFGGIKKLVSRVIKKPTGITPSPIGAIATRARGILTGTRTGRILRAGAGAVGLGGAFELGSRALALPFDQIDENGMRKKRRGINPLNPKAARRAVSRLCRLQHFTDRLEHSLASLVKPHRHHPHRHRHKR